MQEAQPAVGKPTSVCWLAGGRLERKQKRALARQQGMARRILRKVHPEIAVLVVMLSKSSMGCSL